MPTTGSTPPRRLPRPGDHTKTFTRRHSPRHMHAPTAPTTHPSPSPMHDPCSPRAPHSRASHGTSPAPRRVPLALPIYSPSLAYSARSLCAHPAPSAQVITPPLSPHRRALDLLARRDRLESHLASPPPSSVDRRAQDNAATPRAPHRATGTEPRMRAQAEVPSPMPHATPPRHCT